MRRAVACLAALGLVAGCAKAPAANAASGQASGAAAAPAAHSGAPVSDARVSGVYTADGQPAVLADISTQTDDPFDGAPVTLVVMTVRSQGGEPAASDDAHNGKFGDALIVRIEPDGTVIGSDFVHHGLPNPTAISRRPARSG